MSLVTEWEEDVWVIVCVFGIPNRRVAGSDYSHTVKEHSNNHIGRTEKGSSQPNTCFLLCCQRFNRIRIIL